MKEKVSIKANGKLVLKGSIICGITGNEDFEFFVMDKNETPTEIKELFDKFKKEYGELTDKLYEN